MARYQRAVVSFLFVRVHLCVALKETMHSCDQYTAEIDMDINAYLAALPHFDLAERDRCSNTATTQCILGERHITKKHPLMPSGGTVRGTNLNAVAHLFFVWCYEDSPLVDYIFNHTRPTCKDQKKYNTSFGDYYVAFECFPLVTDTDAADYAYLESDSVRVTAVNTQYSLTTFDYVHAYAMLPFLVFHISLIVVLCRAGHHDLTFRESFFVLFILLSVVDAWTVVQDNLFAYCPPLHSLIAVQTGDNPVLETSLASDLGVLVSCYCYIYQPLAHMLIAWNRFNAFRSPTEYRWSWRDRSLKIVVGVTFAVPMLLVASVLPLKYGNFWKDKDPREMQKLVYLLLHFYRASFLVVGSVVGFTLTLFALMYIRKRSSSECSQVDSHERKLLGYSALMLVIQLWVGFWCGVEYLISDEHQLGPYFAHSWRPFWYQSTLTFATRIYCLGGSVFLICVRHAYDAAEEPHTHPNDEGTASAGQHVDRLGRTGQSRHVLDVFLDVFVNNLSAMIAVAEKKVKAMKAARKTKAQILYQVNLVHSKYIMPTWVKTMFTRWKGRLTPAEWNSVLKNLGQMFLLAKYFPG